eukprot:UN21535
MIMIIQKLSMLLKTKRIKEQLHCEKSVWRFDMRSTWKRNTQKKNSLPKPSFQKQNKEFCKRRKQD